MMNIDTGNLEYRDVDTLKLNNVIDNIKHDAVSITLMRKKRPIERDNPFMTVKWDIYVRWRE